MNVVSLTGRLTRDPELHELDDDRTVCNLRLAVDDGRDRDPMYIDVACYGKPGEAVATHMTKGRYVEVTGRLSYREWETDEGGKRSKHEVIGHVTFGPDRPRNDDSGAESQQ